MNEEEWHGPLISLVRPFWSPKDEAPRGFVGFNEELKRRVERLED